MAHRLLTPVASVQTWLTTSLRASAAAAFSLRSSHRRLMKGENEINAYTNVNATSKLTCVLCLPPRGSRVRPLPPGGPGV
jgi:hypothetical protein